MAPGGQQRVRFKLKTSRGEVAGPVLRLLRDDDAWPKTVAAGRRLFLADRDEALLPVASRRLKADERRWAPLAWVFGTGKEQPAAGQPSWLFVPAAWALVLRRSRLQPVSVACSTLFFCVLLRLKRLV